MGAALRTLVINLDTDVERWNTAVIELGRAGIAPERLSAVRGRDLPSSLKPYFDGSPLKAGEIGCYGSHLVACRLLLDSDAPYLLVCEDNIAVRSDALRALLDAAVSAMPPDWDILRVGSRAKKAVVPLKALDTAVHLIRFSKLPRGSMAYLVSRQGAEKLLRPVLRTQTIDDDLKRAWEFDLNTFGLHPAPIVRHPSVTSTIDRVSARGHKYRPFRTLHAGQFSRAVPFMVRTLGPGNWFRCLAVNLGLTQQLGSKLGQMAMASR